MSADGNTLNAINSQCHQLLMPLTFNSSLYYPSYVISGGRDNVLDLGLGLPASGQHCWLCQCSHVSSSQFETGQ